MTFDWRPTSNHQRLRLRAQTLAAIRHFFSERDVLEVETPLLCHTTGTDPQLDFFSSQLRLAPHHPTLFLQTSPEFAMKRLLAAGSGHIYQICKAFRNAESGRFHNPEFTILEWYRIGFDLQALMNETSTLLLELLSPYLGKLSIRQISYQHLFQSMTGLDPLVFCPQDYQQFAASQGLIDAKTLCGEQHGFWLDLLFSHCIQPALPANTLHLVHDYPAIQSSLARIHPMDCRITERFEVFINGMELGNGFFELTNAKEQEQRFEREIDDRQRQGLPTVNKDQRLLAALRHGLPDCSGVALGVDRILMLAGNALSIDEVLSFSTSCA